MPELVITAVGPDRTGLVRQLTGILLERGVNVADSRMINLRGQFALLALVDGPGPAIEAVREMLPSAAKAMGLTVTFGSTASQKPGPAVPWRVKTYSMDQPGIVHRVSDLMHRHGANIEELETSLESAAFAGAPIFTMEMRVAVPVGVQVKTLRAELEELCAALNCDVDLEPG